MRRKPGEETESAEISVLTDHTGRSIRLTQERKRHILEHPEMIGQFALIDETLTEPDRVVETSADETVHVYEKHYAKTPVTSNFCW